MLNDSPMITTIVGERNVQLSTRADSSICSSRWARSGEKLFAARAVWMRSKVEIGVLGAEMAGASWLSSSILPKIWIRLTEMPSPMSSSTPSVERSTRLRRWKRGAWRRSITYPAMSRTKKSVSSTKVVEAQ